MSDGYTPLFSSLLDGTLYGKWPVNGLWGLLLSQCDRHGHIDMVPELLAAKIGMPQEMLLKCIAELMAPDPGSRTQDMEGRRLELIDPNRNWGWRIVNHAKYNQKARQRNKDARRTESGKDAERKRELRASRKGVPPASPLSHPSSHLISTHTHLNSTQNLDRRAAHAAGGAEFETLKQIYPRRAGGQRWPDAQKAINARIREGHTWQELLDSAQRYRDFCQEAGKERTEYVLQAATFFGSNRQFLEAWDKPANKADTLREANVRVSQDWLNAK
jgi:hypothetical protein